MVVVVVVVVVGVGDYFEVMTFKVDLREVKVNFCCLSFLPYLPP